MVNLPNTNLLTIAGIGIIGYFLLSKGSEIGKDLANFGANIKWPDFKIPDIKIDFPNIFNGGVDQEIPQDPSLQTPKEQKEIFGKTLTDTEEAEIKRIDEIVQGGGTVIPSDPQYSFLKDYNPTGIFGFGFLGLGKKGISTGLAQELGIFEFTTEELTKQQLGQLSKIGSGFSLEDIYNFGSRRDDIVFARAFGLDVPMIEPTIAEPQIQIPIEQEPPKQVISLLPTDQEFGGGGIGFIGGTVRENPIDTFVEVLKYCPECTASQIADFLEESGGKYLPSQVGTFDFDVKNIYSPLGQVDANVSVGDLSDANKQAMKLTCKLYNLNC